MTYDKNVPRAAVPWAYNLHWLYDCRYGKSESLKERLTKNFEGRADKHSRGNDAQGGLQQLRNSAHRQGLWNEEQNS